MHCFTNAFIVSNKIFHNSPSANSIIENLNLKAAQRLRLQLSSAEISRAKSLSLLGEEYDLAGLEIEDEDVTESLDESSAEARVKARLLKRHMIAEAKSFAELELLIEALDLLQDISSCIADLRSYVAHCLSNLLLLLTAVVVLTQNRTRSGSKSLKLLCMGDCSS